MTLVFVYGTLKRGYGNNHHYLRDETFVAEGTTQDPFYLVDVGFPFAITESAAGDHPVLPIKGEVFSISGEHTIARLDSLEGEGSMYHREKRMVNTSDGPLECFMYVRRDPPYRMERVCAIEDGAYKWERVR